MAASYNPSGEGGRPAITPASDPRLVRAVVTTHEPRLLDRAQVYTLPGVSGLGSQSFGWEAPEIQWELTLEAESIADLRGFEAEFLFYGAGKRHKLVSETGLEWNYVELIAYEPTGLDSLVGPYATPHVLRQARVRWRWCQPG